MTEISDELFEELKPQLKQILEEAHIDSSDENLNQCRWLIDKHGRFSLASRDVCELLHAQIISIYGYIYTSLCQHCFYLVGLSDNDSGYACVRLHKDRQQ